MTKNRNDEFNNCISIILRLKSIFVLLFSLFITIKCCNGIQSLKNDCPIYCTCSIWYNLKWASCSGKNLVNIHTGLGEMVQALDLSNNSISKLIDYELTTIGMKNLKYLNLSHNAISEIGLFAFSQLNALAVLDLSQNHFNYIHPDVLINNNNLRIVKLMGNNFHNGPPHLTNPTITELDLRKCQISYLTVGIFNGVKQLKKLDIANNILIELDIGILRGLPRLELLKINENPWLCNSAMKLLKIYLNSKFISYNKSICFDKNSHSNINNPSLQFQNIKLINNNSNKFIVMLKNNGNSDEILSNISATNELINSSDKINCNNYKSIDTSIEFPLWLFILGFIVGCASGMLIIYIWLSKQQSNPSQELSLLDNLSIDSDETLPTYFEVMSHTNFHPQI